MTTQLKVPNAQYPLTAVFGSISIAADSMVNTSGVLTSFGATTGTTYDVLDLPPNAIVTGGEIVVTTASDAGTTATISVGDPTSATRYASAVNLKSAARTALTLTGRVSPGEKIRVTLANVGTVATVGAFYVTVQFIVMGRALENLKTS